MREILFRGKRLDNDEWVFGHYVVAENMPLISVFDITKPFLIIPETLGQYVGIDDVNGGKIFEGDIVIDRFSSSTSAKRAFAVIFSTEEIASCGCCYNPFVGSGFVGETEGDWHFDRCNLMECEIVGNIYDNPTLIKEYYDAYKIDEERMSIRAKKTIQERIISRFIFDVYDERKNDTFDHCCVQFDKDDILKPSKDYQTGAIQILQDYYGKRNNFVLVIDKSLKKYEEIRNTREIVVQIGLGFKSIKIRYANMPFKGMLMPMTVYKNFLKYIYIISQLDEIQSITDEKKEKEVNKKWEQRQSISV